MHKERHDGLVEDVERSIVLIFENFFDFYSVMRHPIVRRNKIIYPQIEILSAIIYY